jgi:protein-tyrosine phosphatase
MKPYSILFVCMGNICRSPTAHGVFRHKVQARGLSHVVKVDSAGTHNYHPGSPPDGRSQRHAVKRGYDLSDLRARQIEDADFESFDLILAMDWDNLALIQADCPPRHQAKLRRLTEFCEQHDSDLVPDPYYGGSEGFEDVLDLVEDACDGLLRHVLAQIK